MALIKNGRLTFLCLDSRGMALSLQSSSIFSHAGIIGFAMSSRMKKGLAIAALRKALMIRQPGKGLIPSLGSRQSIRQ